MPKSLYGIGVSYGAAMRRLTLVIAVVCLAAILLGCIEQDGETKPVETEPVLSDYPELFGKDVMIVIGSNASGIEIEGADAIVENLFNLTGNMPVIKTDAEITEGELAGHNLILVGGADSNEVLREVYDMTDAMRVTDEYPGAGKGVLEMLRNPWDLENVMLLVAGSDEWGTETTAIALAQPQQLAGDRVVIDRKASGLLFKQIRLREKQIADPRADRLEQMKASGMSVENLSIQRIFIYFTQKPTAVQVKELQDLGIILYMDSWIPPVGTHPAGFIVADMSVDKLDDLASKDYVVRIDTAEQLREPLTIPGDEENIKIIHQGGSS
jgi:hypothetical protein